MEQIPQQQQQLFQQQQQQQSEQFFKHFYSFPIKQHEIQQQQQQQILQNENMQQQEQDQMEEQFQQEIIYPINYTLSEDKQFIFFSMSNRSIGIYQILNQQEIKEIHTIQDAHQKKINQLLVEDNVLYSCSNDNTIKLWDLNNQFQLIKQLNKPPHEIQCIAKSKHILAAGSDKDSILFWDLQKMKGRGQFDETLPNEVTSLQFSKESNTTLLGGSLEGMVALFDLTQGSEEDAAQFVIRVEQPIDKVSFYGGSQRYAYAISTTNTIYLLDMNESRVIRSLNTINYNEYNQNYLISVYEHSDSTLRYLLGKPQGEIEEYQIEENRILRKRIYSSHKEGQITCAVYLQDNLLLTCGEDGSINLLKETQKEDIFQQKTLIEMEEEDQYYENEVNNQNLNNQNNMIIGNQQQPRSISRNINYSSKKQNFNPF